MAASRNRELRVVAIVEAIKGVLVLVAAGILFRLLHADVQHAAEALVRHFHLDPARHHPGVFIATAVDFGNAHKVALSFGALAYAAVRFVEAWGLWGARGWAWGFGIISAAMYLPFELAQLTQRLSWAALAVLLLNVGVVFMLWRARDGAR